MTSCRRRCIMSHHVHRQTDRKSDYVISTNVQYIHLGRDNKKPKWKLPTNHINVKINKHKLTTNTETWLKWWPENKTDQFYTVPKKRPTLWLSISSPNINWFSKFFHRYILWTISNKVITEYPAIRKLCRYTTSWNINAKITSNHRQQACWYTKYTSSQYDTTLC